MVATVSARKDVSSALQYFTHMRQDDYYLKDEEKGRWFGRASEILKLNHPVSKEAFGLALNGRDPHSASQLVKLGQKSNTHQPGWDITLSAPKSVSVLWGLAPDEEKRLAIQEAHSKAVLDTCRHIEKNFAFCRRGHGGANLQKTDGLLFAIFHHKTSRSLCPQLHSHAFTFNMAPRTDGTWGGIISKPFYEAQKKIGAHYRKALHHELRKLHIPSQLYEHTIKIDGISRDLEKVFSVRRQQIVEAVEKYGYAKNAKGFELANLRSRSKKEAAPIKGLIKVWRQRALDRGFHPNEMSKIWDNRIVMNPLHVMKPLQKFSRANVRNLAVHAANMRRNESITFDFALPKVLRAARKLHRIMTKSKRVLMQGNHYKRTR